MRIFEFLKILVMEIAEYILRSYRKTIAKGSAGHDLNKIGEDGFFVVEDFLSESECNKYKDLLDKFISEKKDLIWQDELGADTRIYFASKRIPEFNKLFCDEFIRKSLKGYTGCKNPVGFAMANKLSFVDGSLGSGGGWHRDSLISHQFKTILYLSDVTSENGPFQYIKGSHRKSSVIKAFFRGLATFGKTRFKPHEVQTFLERSKEREVATLTGKKGTLLMVDTKGIHRGMPLNVGNRYALTTYFWANKIPKHIMDLETTA